MNFIEMFFLSKNIAVACTLSGGRSIQILPSKSNSAEFRQEASIISQMLKLKSNGAGNAPPPEWLIYG